MNTTRGSVLVLGYINLAKETGVVKSVSCRPPKGSADGQKVWLKLNRKIDVWQMMVLRRTAFKFVSSSKHQQLRHRGVSIVLLRYVDIAKNLCSVYGRPHVHGSTDGQKLCPLPFTRTTTFMRVKQVRFRKDVHHVCSMTQPINNSHTMILFVKLANATMKTRTMRTHTRTRGDATPPSPSPNRNNNSKDAQQTPPW